MSLSYSEVFPMVLQRSRGSSCETTQLLKEFQVETTNVTKVTFVALVVLQKVTGNLLGVPRDD